MNINRQLEKRGSNNPAYSCIFLDSIKEENQSSVVGNNVHQISFKKGHKVSLNTIQVQKGT